MEKETSNMTKSSRLFLATAFAGVLVLWLLGLYFMGDIVGVDSVPRIMANKMETLSALRIHLFKSVDLEKSAVMADTDEASIHFAKESLRAAEAGERNRLELAGLIEKHPSGKEADLLREFDACWFEFRRINLQVLDFAVQNTNLKAARLSFGAGSAAMRQFENEMSRLIRDFPGGPICRPLFNAQTAALKINVLHAPHIASPDDEEMDGLEKVIRENDAVVKRSLSEITSLLPPDKKAILQQAIAEYEVFMEVTARVIELSRQNTNVKSFELSLNRKRKTTAQCDEILTSLQDAVQSRSFKATR